MAAQSWTAWLQDVIQVGTAPLKAQRKREVTRLEIAADASYALPEGICEIRVVKGRAWICSDKKDLVACHGQRVVFAGKDQVRTIVPLEQKLLVIDVYSRG